MFSQEFDALLRQREGQNIEFKASLTTQRRQEAIQSLVAFANSDRGRVFFGVNDDGSVNGVQVGNKTPEDFAAEVKMHTYPSLPVSLEQFDHNGKAVLMAEAVRDTPPVVGVYLYSDKPIPPDKPVDASMLQAIRRVGRTNEKIELMWLRGYRPSDPRVRITIREVYPDSDGRLFMRGRIWVEEGSASAHEIEVSADPPHWEISGPATASHSRFGSVRGARGYI